MDVYHAHPWRCDWEECNAPPIGQSGHNPPVCSHSEAWYAISFAIAYTDQLFAELRGDHPKLVRYSQESILLGVSRYVRECARKYLQSVIPMYPQPGLRRKAIESVMPDMFQVGMREVVCELRKSRDWSALQPQPGTPEWETQPDPRAIAP